MLSEGMQREEDEEVLLRQKTQQPEQGGFLLLLILVNCSFNAVYTGPFGGGGEKDGGKAREEGRIQSSSFTLISTVWAIGSSVQPSWCHTNDGSPLPLGWKVKSFT